MKKPLLIIISAVLCGILVILMPFYVLRQIDFPDKYGYYCAPASADVRGRGAMQLPYGMSERFPMSPFYIALVLSFIGAISTYIISKKRL